MAGGLKLFALGATAELGERVAGELGIPLAAHEEREFEDGEHKARPLEDVIGKDVFVLHSLYGDENQSVNDKLCRLLFFLGAVRQASAARVTPVVPYLCYGRKDRKTKPRDPVTAQYVARLFESIGIDLFVALDVHNLPAFHNAFRCPTHHLEARKIMADHLAPLLAAERVTVLSPDAGGVKRAEKFREAFSEVAGRAASSAFIDKHRSEGAVSSGALVGNVEGRTVLVVDDLISTGTTMRRAAAACRKAGAVKVLALATHGLFTGNAADAMDDEQLDGFWITDSVPPFRLPRDLIERKGTVLSCAPLLAEAIERIHQGRSLVELLAL